MYKVLIVEDEASAANFIKQIIEKKCPNYQLIAVAANGREALEKIEQIQPDVVISDIRMPVMDGIQLVEKISRIYPEIFVVLVTGYQEFEYAQKALRAGVSEYLLKPVKPKELQQLMENLAVEIDRIYYEKRIKVFQQLVKQEKDIKKSEVEACFEAGKYYALLLRKKGLPKRFSAQDGIPIYSLANEQFFIYGRDEMEVLYLIHAKYLFEESFDEFVKRIFNRFCDTGSYSTCIQYGHTFEIMELPKVIKKLYRSLNSGIVIGKDQIICSDNKSDYDQVGEAEKMLCERIEYYIRYKETYKMKEILSALFELWREDERTQIYIEKQMDHIFYELGMVYDNKEQFEETVYALEEAFFYAEDLNDLQEVVMQMIQQFDPQGQVEKNDDKEELFQEILIYLENHMHEEITIPKICSRFGVSQTSLSRMFRRKEQCSFSNYLMRLRIECAKRVMDQDKEVFVKDVAERVGYKDQFYFSRIFRSIVGKSPSEYLDG